VQLDALEAQIDRDARVHRARVVVDDRGTATRPAAPDSPHRCRRLLSACTSRGTRRTSRVGELRVSMYSLTARAFCLRASPGPRPSCREVEFPHRAAPRTRADTETFELVTAMFRHRARTRSCAASTPDAPGSAARSVDGVTCQPCSRRIDYLIGPLAGYVAHKGKRSLTS
jgi:hypothetical protein